MKKYTPREIIFETESNLEYEFIFDSNVEVMIVYNSENTHIWNN